MRPPINIVPHYEKVKIYGNEVKIQTDEVYELNYLEVDIVDHCNLNCRGCTHFCSLAEEKYMNPEEFRKDLSELVKKIPKIAMFRILGGEPLLHKDINKFLQYSRELLPESDIRLVTNCILLNKMTDDFWETLKKYNIGMDLSKYPPLTKQFLDSLDKIDEKQARLKHVQVCNKFYLPLSPVENDAGLSFKKCSEVCKTIKNGKLYHCPIGAFIFRYNKKYNKALPEETGINIYKSSAQEIKEYLETPMETCKYCALPYERDYVQWSASKREIEEWASECNKDLTV